MHSIPFTSVFSTDVDIFLAFAFFLVVLSMYIVMPFRRRKVKGLWEKQVEQR